MLWVAIAVLTEFTENWYQNYTLPKSFSVRVDITDFTELTETLTRMRQSETFPVVMDMTVFTEFAEK